MVLRYKTKAGVVHEAISKRNGTFTLCGNQVQGYYYNLATSDITCERCRRYVQVRDKLLNEGIIKDVE